MSEKNSHLRHRMSTKTHNTSMPPDGKIVNGRLEGTFTTLFPDGSPKFQRHYIKGFLHGLCKQWLPDGTLAGEFQITYGTGCMRAWHDTGKIMIESEINAGEAHGATRTYDTAGHFCTTYYWRGEKVSKKRYLANQEQESQTEGQQ